MTSFDPYEIKRVKVHAIKCSKCKLTPMVKADKMAKILRQLLVLAICISSIACASRIKVPFEVTSDPSGAPVDVNGVYAGDTPTTLTLSTTMRWAGYCVVPGGWEYGDETYTVTVCPPPRRVEKLHCHTKNIKPSMTLEGAGLFFDLKLKPVYPTQPF